MQVILQGFNKYWQGSFCYHFHNDKNIQVLHDLKIFLKSGSIFSPFGVKEATILEAGTYGTKTSIKTAWTTIIANVIF